MPQKEILINAATIEAKYPGLTDRALSNPAKNDYYGFVKTLFIGFSLTLSVDYSLHKPRYIVLLSLFKHKLIFLFSPTFDKRTAILDVGVTARPW